MTVAENTPDNQMKPQPAFTGEPVSIQAQSVLYNNGLEDIHRSLASLARSAELAITNGVCSFMRVALGDSSSIPCISDSELLTLQKTFERELAIEYIPFGANLGSAQGHNRLAGPAETDFLFIYNPNVVVSPVLFQQMLQPFKISAVGIVEAKQLPVEHPKDYDVTTGETSWASTACTLTPTKLLKAVNGFDAECFFLYCDDVDYSWRVRLAGFKVIFQPAAMVFHDKRLSQEGRWQPTGAEHYYSAEAALMLAHKWSRPDLVRKTLQYFKESHNGLYERAAVVFEDRRDQGKLPVPLDPEHAVGQFVDVFYAKHRFAL
jgi:GT2 family glycosyltransferase